MTTGTNGDDSLSNDPNSPNDNVQALGGNDTITIIPPNTDDPGYVPVFVDGGAGDDTLVFEERLPDRTSRRWRIDHLIGSGFEGRIKALGNGDEGVDVTWTSIENLSIYGVLTTTDSLATGESDDFISLNPDVTTLRLFTNGGDDHVVLQFGFTSAIVFAGDGNDRVELDRVLANVADPDSYRIYGGAGNDILRGTPVPGAVDFLYGEAGDDEIEGNAGDDLLDGGTGADLILGGDGDDDLRGGDGADTLIGGLGNDRLDGGAGLDRMEGGPGDDFYLIDDGRDVIVELADQGIDTVRAVGNYRLSDHLDNLILAGNAFNGIGNALDNEITGTTGNDTLNGKAGDDLLRGSAGDDVLIGEFGADRLEGGGGSDTFAYRATGHSSPSAPDRILDFTVGFDKIDVSGINAVKATAGDEAFQFIGSQAFSGTAGELRAAKAGDNSWIVEADNDGDGLADLLIEVVAVNSSPMTAADFVL